MASKPRRTSSTRQHGFDRVRKMGLALPGAIESTSWNSPSLKIGGTMFACLASHSSAEPNSLVVCIGFAARDELIAADPDVYYLKDHYVGHPSMLVRLSRVHDDALRDLLRMAWQFVGRPGARPLTTTSRAPRQRTRATR